MVDNASTDESLYHAMKMGDGSLPIEFIPLRTNVGFAKANNIALRFAPHDSHVLLLNPDTEVMSGAFEQLLNFLKQHSRAGVVGPKLVNGRGLLQPSIRRLPTMRIVAWLFLKLHYLWPQDKAWQEYLGKGFDYTREGKAPQVMGAAFVIRRDLLWGEGARLVGLLDEGFYLWFEEVDYCARAVAAGWEVWYMPGATIRHYGGVSFRQLRGPKRTWPFLRSALYYSAKHFGSMATFLLWALVPVSLALSVVAAVVEGKQDRGL